MAMTNWSRLMKRCISLVKDMEERHKVGSNCSVVGEEEEEDGNYTSQEK